MNRDGIRIKVLLKNFIAITFQYFSIFIITGGIVPIESRLGRQHKTIFSPKIDIDLSRFNHVMHRLFVYNFVFEMFIM